MSFFTSYLHFFINTCKYRGYHDALIRTEGKETKIPDFVLGMKKPRNLPNLTQKENLNLTRYKTVSQVLSRGTTYRECRNGPVPLPGQCVTTEHRRPVYSILPTRGRFKVSLTPVEMTNDSSEVSLHKGNLLYRFRFSILTPSFAPGSDSSRGEGVTVDVQTKQMNLLCTSTKFTDTLCHHSYFTSNQFFK